MSNAHRITEKLVAVSIATTSVVVLFGLYLYIFPPSLQALSGNINMQLGVIVMLLGCFGVLVDLFATFRTKGLRVSQVGLVIPCASVRRSCLVGLFYMVVVS